MLAILASLLAAPAPEHCASARVQTREVSFAVTRTAVVACGRVLRRARLVQPPRSRPRGAIVAGAAATGRRVVWIETRFRAGQRTVELVTDGDRRRLLRRDRSPLVPAVDVVATRRGELAWLAPAGRDPAQNRVVVDLPDRAPRTVARVAATNLAVDDGFTVRWSAYGRNYGFYDLPRTHGPACPDRRRYGVLAENAHVRVTRRLYRGPDDIDMLIVRACARGQGPDRVVVEAERGVSNRADVTVSGLHGAVAELAVTTSERHDPCIGGTRRVTVDVRTGHTLGESWTPACG